MGEQPHCSGRSSCKTRSETRKSQRKLRFTQRLQRGMMSAELLSVSVPRGNNGSLQGTTLGGAKPIHRFLKGQPKIVGTIMLILGASSFISLLIMTNHIYIRLWAIIPPGFLQGSLLIICGIMYVLTEHNPTKKTVTISLCLSMVSILAAIWTLLLIVPYMDEYDVGEIFFGFENDTESQVPWVTIAMNMSLSLEAIFVFYTLVGAVILIVMSVLAGAALRSTKIQATVVMTTAATETPTVEQAQDVCQ